MSRTYEHIAGDLEAAKRNVERLEAELAGVSPSTLEIKNVIGSGSLRFEHMNGALDVYTHHFTLNTAPLLNIFRESEVEALRDWLNYHFPKEDADV